LQVCDFASTRLDIALKFGAGLFMVVGIDDSSNVQFLDPHQEGCFVVENLDRLSRRDIREASRILNAFMDSGVAIHTWSDNRIYDAKTFDLTDYILAGVTQARAREESARKSERVAATWHARRNNAKNKPVTGVCPGWLKLSADGTHFELIPDRAKIIKHIFEESIKIGIYRLVQRLNETKVPSFGHTKGWSSSKIAKILKNRATIGEYQLRH
jgi:DNA invertase Pin-like site-specific DNA recombinase